MIITQQLKKAMKADFKVFLYVLWDFLGLPEPTKAQYELADFLQYGPKRKMLMAFRGVGKSWITSAYVIWKLWKDPDLKFLVVSASKARADDFTAFTKRIIREFPVVQHLKAKEGQRDTMIAFDVGPARAAHAPSVKSVGIFGQLTGSRANEIIADDIEVANNSQTEDAREKLQRAVEEFEAILVPEGTPTITYLGTPQSEESVYNKLPERGYTVRIWPVRYPRRADLEKYRGNLAPSIYEALEAGSACEGDPVDPARFDELDILEREASYGRSGFALQFMLDTTLSDAEKYPLKLADLVVMSVNPTKAPVNVAYASGPQQLLKDLKNLGFTGDRWYGPLFVDKDWTEYEGTCMFIDPSGRGKDETAYAIAKLLHGFIFLVDCGGFSGGYDRTTLEGLARLAKQHGANDIISEANFGDGMFNQLFLPVLNKLYPEAGLQEVRHTNQKERRIIDTLEPVMNQHRLIVDRKLVEKDIKQAEDDPKYSLFYQMTRITKDRGSLRQDDRLEAVYGAVNHWVETMARDGQVAADAHRETLLEADLEAFMDHVVGSKYKATRGGANWLNSQVQSSPPTLEGGRKKGSGYYKST